MQLAINKAWQHQLLTYPNPAVGATVVLNNQVLSVSSHIKAGGPHAEVNAIKDAFIVLNPQSTLKTLTTSHDIQIHKI
jgi:diaminohydroxyphosphoribosylaminopyrimidine deaminase/5-amino-6-(5-phosphoribosylamino)uracil reductase